MPYINLKVTPQVSDEKKEAIKSALGEALAIFEKSEEWLMICIEDEKEIWFGGNKREKAAFVGMSLVGVPTDEACVKFTKAVCNLLEKELDIPQNAIYITFQPVDHAHWGWNGQTF